MTGRSNSAFEPDPQQKSTVVVDVAPSARQQRPRQRVSDVDSTGFSNVAFQHDDEPSSMESNKTPPPPYPASEVVMAVLESEDISHHKATERATWGNPIEFLMSCIAMSVGLGTRLRNPFLL